jgi:hypothetical protein
MVEVWFQDEVWIGPKNKLTYRWAGKGSRLRTIRDQRTQSTYPFGAVRAASLQHRGHAASCRRDRHQGHPWHSRRSHPRSAAWQGAKDLKVPSNISFLPLPPRAAAQQPRKHWQFMRQYWLSNRIFKSIDDNVDLLLCLEVIWRGRQGVLRLRFG